MTPYETYQRRMASGWTRIDMLLALYDGAILRLEQAHATLRASAKANVSEIALACGFTHFSRFAETYRRHYGETPSVTLRRARSRHR